MPTARRSLRPAAPARYSRCPRWKGWKRPWIMPRATRGSRPIAPSLAARGPSGNDVVVQVEKVVRVVPALHLDQAVVVRAVGRPDSVPALIVGEVVEPAPPGEVLLE